MNEHPVTTARRSVRDLIRDHLPVFGKRVWTNRVQPLTRAKMPCAVIYTVEEDAEIEDDGPRSYVCETTFAVQVYCHVAPAVDDDHDDELDRLAWAVRRLLGLDSTLAGCVLDLWYKRAEWTPENHADRVYASCRLTFGLKYREDAPEQDARGMNALRQIGVEWDAAPDPDGSIDERDLVEFPE